jgi:hypothetical protein
MGKLIMNVFAAPLCGLTLAALLAPAVAFAADPGFCRDYASHAVQQDHSCRIIPGCFEGPSPRWQSDWKAHRNWCLGADPVVAQSEDEARSDHLATWQAIDEFRAETDEF